MELLGFTNINDGGYIRIRLLLSNKGEVPFDRMAGDLEIYKDKQLLYACRCQYEGEMPVGSSAKIIITEYNTLPVQRLLAYPLEEMTYTWTTASARYKVMGLSFMLGAIAHQDKRKSSDFDSAKSSYDHAFRQAASYRQQGSLINAENAEHRMRQAEAAMLKVKAEAKGNSRAFEDARKDYEDASRRYASYKSQGLEADAQRCKDYMDRAHAKMMQNI